MFSQDILVVIWPHMWSFLRDQATHWRRGLRWRWPERNVAATSPRPAGGAVGPASLWHFTLDVFPTRGTKGAAVFCYTPTTIASFHLPEVPNIFSCTKMDGCFLSLDQPRHDKGTQADARDWLASEVTG